MGQGPQIMWLDETWPCGQFVQFVCGWRARRTIWWRGMAKMISLQSFWSSITNQLENGSWEHDSMRCFYFISTWEKPAKKDVELIKGHTGKLRSSIILSCHGLPAHSSKCNDTELASIISPPINISWHYNYQYVEDVLRGTIGVTHPWLGCQEVAGGLTNLAANGVRDQLDQSRSGLTSLAWVTVMKGQTLSTTRSLRLWVILQRTRSKQSKLTWHNIRCNHKLERKTHL